LLTLSSFYDVSRFSRLEPDGAAAFRGLSLRLGLESPELVEPRGVELEKSALMSPEDEIIPVPASRRGCEGGSGSGPTA
jgi:hypothetical protein